MHWQTSVMALVILYGWRSLLSFFFCIAQQCCGHMHLYWQCVCVYALHATNYTDVHIDKIFDSSRYVENGIHIRFAFQFGSLRWLCGVFYSFANNSRFVRMWKICFYGASLSKRVSTFAVPTTLFVMLRSNEIRSIVVNRSWLSYSSKSMQPLHSLCQSCMTLTVNKNCSPSARSAL